jgi:uncharacterized protein YbgA (DUF1722 family)/uncharacterized protein YbbK (DUF523 family)
MSLPTLGISQCLLGYNVRYNGGHKHSPLCTEELAKVAEFRPLCPEVGAGLGVPRAPIRMVQRDTGIRLERADGSHSDVSAEVFAWCSDTVKTLSHLDGFILTPRSPTCGLQGVKIYHPNGHPMTSGPGTFARDILRAWPCLPVEDAGRLNDPRLRENFILRVFLHHEWRTQVRCDLSPSALLGFHTRHKYQLMAHSPQAYRMLGRMLSNLSVDTLDVIADTYFHALMDAMRKPATRQRHANALQHLQGYLKTFMTPAQTREMCDTIDSYRLGRVPLIVPMTLIRHFAISHPDSTRYLASQSYLDPYPAELGLRNAI